MAMEKTFNAAEAENRLFTAWEEAGCFKAGANAKPQASGCLIDDGAMIAEYDWSKDS